jgi:hypothetical protein
MPPLHAPKVGAMVPSVSIEGLLKEAGRLGFPDPLARGVERLHERLNGPLVKAAGKCRP